MAPPPDVILMALVDIFSRGWIKVPPSHTVHRPSSAPADAAFTCRLPLCC
ncbi:hypothetical protein HPP92_024814 [Vanilla planifolia]|uniref:Uncharacterized protein n=1 Tax=Vanilla planifolia TaxID=51239 RepID=A0A835PJF1_VANPL|nr:hypothetical protein HPP92_025072 [Vanilla planifolia]KAG0453510.1 hypothetical protein HPP92_024814 [Vanilla planifolia]